VHACLRRGGRPGPCLRGEPVLGGDAHPALLLLNGPLRNAARGRGPRSKGGGPTNGTTGQGRVVQLRAGGTSRLRVRPQTGRESVVHHRRGRGGAGTSFRA